MSVELRLRNLTPEQEAVVVGWIRRRFREVFDKDTDEYCVTMSQQFWQMCQEQDDANASSLEPTETPGEFVVRERNPFKVRRADAVRDRLALHVVNSQTVVQHLSNPDSSEFDPELIKGITYEIVFSIAEAITGT